MNLIANIDEENIVNALLEGAGLSSFTFHTNFVLKFCCKINKKFSEKQLPMEVNLSIMSDWWFGDKEDWDKTVNKLTKEFNFVEPDEPVLAFKLAALRWSDGSDISYVHLSSEKIELIFDCGESITILNNNKEEGLAWEIFECNFQDVNNCWSMACENGEIYYSLPK